MDWYDIDDILIDGTKENISDVVCPDCGTVLKRAVFLCPKFERR